MTRAQDFNLTALMEAHEVRRVERNAGRFVVELLNRNIGIGASVGGALERAKAADAVNIGRAA